MIEQALDWAANSPVGNYLADNPNAFPIIEIVHVMAISGVLGMLAIVDLRLIGWASTGYKVSRLTRSLLPITWGAFVLAVLTGGALFCSQPATYFGNTAFRLKMLLIVAAGLNMLVFHILTWKSIDAWDHKPAGPFAVRLAGGLSMLIWIGVVICGRWIGFTMSPF